MIHDVKVRKRASSDRDLRRQDQAALQLDGSFAFHEKDLDHDAEEFIVSWAQESPRIDHFMLIVHVNQSPEPFSQELVEEAVRNYFAYRARLSAMELKRLFKQGRTSLIIGLFFLATCFLLREFLIRQPDQALLRFARESLTIADGWRCGGRCRFFSTTGGPCGTSEKSTKTSVACQSSCA